MNAFDKFPLLTGLKKPNKEKCEIAVIGAPNWTGTLWNGLY